MPRAYYNEFDPFASKWLRELIADDLIADGDVDERSILDVRPADLKGYNQCHFFAGIGGWSYALRLAGLPDDRPVWTGSCPCQPLSSAGQQKGHADERHLWPAFYELIAKCGPPTVFGEQVASKLGREWLAGVRADLEDARYAVGAADLCAAGAGAPHIRQRLFWVAHAERLERGLPILERRSQQARPETERRREVGGVANSHEGQRGAEREQRQQPQDGGTGELEQEQWQRKYGGQPSGGKGRRQLGGESGTAEMGTTGNRGRTFSHTGSVHVGDAERLKFERVGDAAGAGLQEWAGREVHQSHPQQRPERPSSTHWRGSWLKCADGKSRRVPPQPGLFPLAHGIPNRVGTLRGAGNAIVPQVAAEFIKAVMYA